MSFQAYIDNIQAKTGKTPGDFKKLAEKKGLLKPSVKAGEITTWLKQEFELGHGHAMAIYATLKPHMNQASVGHFADKLAKPAQRALQQAGITSLKQLSALSEDAVLELHGIGENALLQLKQALLDNGMSFSVQKKKKE